MIKILIVNDSPLHQKILLALLEQQPGYNIVGVASHGTEAVRMNRQFSPDIILMDIHMPVTNGVEATRQIMKEKPARILIVTSTFTANMTWIFDAQAAGAADVTKTPVVQLDASGRLTVESLVKAGASLIQKIDVLAKAPLRYNVSKSSPMKHSIPARAFRLTQDIADKVVAIGASTGGPNVILQILSGLTNLSRTAILITQHINHDFSDSLVQWLADNTRLSIKQAQTGDLVQAGQVYAAPGGRHSVQVIRGNRLKVITTPGHLIYSPNISLFMESVAMIYGANALGIILTGMGDDGATGLLKMRQMGATTTAQDSPSCVIDAMPAAARKIGAVQRTYPLNTIADNIMKWMR